MPTEERVMRAREVVKRALDSVEHQMDNYLPAKGESGRDCERRRLIETMADYMLDFADEGSGIGELRQQTVVVGALRQAKSVCERIRDESRHDECEGGDYRRGFRAGANGCALFVLELINRATAREDKIDLIDRREVLSALDKLGSGGEQSDFADGYDTAIGACVEIMENAPPIELTQE